MKYQVLKGKTRKIQMVIKIALLVFVTVLAVLHQLKGIIVAPPIHAICPFGALESLVKFVTEGHYIQKIFSATFFLMGGTILVALLFRRGFCGWICPLGVLQEFFTYIGRLLKLKQNVIPDVLDKCLKVVKYIGLIIILWASWKTGELVFAPYDPWAAYGHLAAGGQELFGEFLVGTIFLLVGMLGSIFIPQNWCKYFCPMAAILGGIAKASPSVITRNKESCIDCKLCDRHCPVSLKVSEMDKVTSAECLQCGDCLSVCPKDETLQYKFAGKWTMKPIVYGIATLLIFFGTVGVAKQMNWWNLGFSSFKEVLTNDRGELDPALIKGGMPLKAVAHEFHIPITILKEKLGIPLTTPNDKALKVIASEKGVEVEVFREKVSELIRARESGE